MKPFLFTREGWYMCAAVVGVCAVAFYPVLNGWGSLIGAVAGFAGFYLIAWRFG